MPKVCGVLHGAYPHIANHRRTWKIKREGGVATKNTYTVVVKGPAGVRPVTPQLQDRTTRSTFTVVSTGTVGTHVKSR